MTDSLLASTGKRQLAFVVGSVAAVAAVGAGVYYYTKKSQNVQKSSPCSSKTKPVANVQPQTPQNIAQTLKNSGNECFKKGQFAEAVEYYTKAIDACPADTPPIESSMFFQNRAAAYEKLNNFQQVIADCTKALEGNKRYLKAIQRRAKAFERLGQYEEALRDYTALCILEQFKNYATMASADQVLKTLSNKLATEALELRGNKPIQLSKSFVETYFLSFSEDPILNHISYQQRIRQQGAGDTVSNGHALENAKGFDKAQQLLLTQQYDDVADACTEEIESHGERFIHALLLRGTFFLLSGLSDAAAKDFEQFFSVTSRLSEEDEEIMRLKSNAYIKRGSLHMQHGRKAESLEDFESARKAFPANVDLFHHRGQLYLLLTETDLALEDFNEAVRIRPDFAPSLAQRCYTKYRAAVQSTNYSAMASIMSEFERLVGQFPDCVDLLTMYAQALAESQDIDQAKRLFDRVLTLMPNNATIHVHKALLEVQAENGDVALAAKTIQHAIKIDPFCEFAYETLGNLELQRGNMKLAMELFDKAITLSRTDLEMTHIFMMRQGILVQKRAVEEFGLEVPSDMPPIGMF